MDQNFFNIRLQSSTLKTSKKSETDNNNNNNNNNLFYLEYKYSKTLDTVQMIQLKKGQAESHLGLVKAALLVQEQI